MTENELKKTLLQLPAYSPEIVNENQAERLLALNDIYGIYVPTEMSVEIYAKLYTALYRSLNLKGTRDSVIRANDIFRSRGIEPYSSVIGGSDCMTIIGDPGIGKSRAISEAIKLIAGENHIETEHPFCKIIPVLTVQTPYDCSIKSLLLEILRETDKHLKTDFYDNAVKSKATVDLLIMSVSAIALEHIGMIIVDEIQSVIKAKQGRNLVGCLTQLINNAQIAIVMVGTPSCIDFFESEMFLARRAVGLRYGPLPYSAEFNDLCRYLFSYQYIRNTPVLSDDLCYWLWEKTQGNISALIGMIAGAQEIAILEGTEELNRNSLQQSYDRRLASMQPFLRAPQRRYPKASTSCSAIKSKKQNNELMAEFSYAGIVQRAKREGIDPLKALFEHGMLEEIPL